MNCWTNPVILVNETHHDGFLRLYRHDRSHPESPVCMLENDRLSLYWNDSFGSRRVIAQSAMGSLGVVVFSSSHDRNQRLAGATEELSTEHFFAGPGIEAHAAHVFPRQTQLGVRFPGYAGRIQCLTASTVPSTAKRAPQPFALFEVLGDVAHDRRDRLQVTALAAQRDNGELDRDLRSVLPDCRN